MAEYKQKDYQESDAVRQAKAALEQQAALRPGDYQSQWQKTLNDTINKIQNREKFTYDLNGDALYQQYKDRYVQQGQMAMMDTMGQAAALTGGYGSSYGQSVGQQAYQGYLQGLNDKVPELYQLALSQYNQQGQDLYNLYSMLGEREASEYGRYRDSLGDWQSERDYLSNQYNAERDYDYGKYSDERNFDYGKFTDDRNYQYQVGRDQVADSQWNQSFQYQQDRDKVSDSQWEQSFQYQQGRDQVSDSQWQKEFEEAMRQYNQNYAFSQQQYEDSKKASSSSSRSSSSPSSNSGVSGWGYDTHGYSAADIMALQRNAGIDVDGDWGPDTQAAWEAGYTKDGGPKKPTYSTGELMDAAAAGMSYSQIEAVLRDRGVDTSKATVQADIRKALSK